jgi:hypothetical protein
MYVYINWWDAHLSDSLAFFALENENIVLFKQLFS